MQKIIITFLICFIFTKTFGQFKKNVSTYLQGQYTHTISDRTIDNNPWGLGLGVQTFFTLKTKLDPTIELAADTYLQDDKVFRTNPDGTPIDDLGNMVNLFFGVVYNPIRPIYFSLIAGPSFSNGHALLGIKPLIGFYCPGNKKWTAKIYYINIFNRDQTTKQDFSAVSLAIGRKLF